MTKKEIGSLLKKERKAKNLSLYYVSKHSKLAISQVRSIENADKAYTVDSLLAVANVLDYGVQLVQYSGEPSGT
jgi:transcriptional regulator with XRE-family HTH domain